MPEPANQKTTGNPLESGSRCHGSRSRPALIYLPGLHGDWTLVSSFRAAVRDEVCFVEFAYPRRPEWGLEDYARHIGSELARHGVEQGTLLAESFGSQVAWKLLELVQRGTVSFQPQRLILAGGFVRHPAIWGVHLFHCAQRRLPWPCFQLLLRGYARYARLRHRQAPETLASIGEFVQRRTREDNLAIASRYPLIASNDLRPIARQTTIPVFALSGVFDPIVPWPLVHPWLRRHCPGFRERRLITRADHNVLGTAPEASARQVLAWMREGNPARALSRSPETAPLPTVPS